MSIRSSVCHGLFKLFIKALIIIHCVISPLVLIYSIYSYVIWLNSINDIISNILTFINFILIIINLFLTTDLFYYAIDDISRNLLKVKMLIDGSFFFLNIVYISFVNFYIDNIKIYSISIYLASLLLLMCTILIYNSHFLHAMYTRENKDIEKTEMLSEKETPQEKEFFIL